MSPGHTAAGFDAEAFEREFPGFAKPGAALPGQCGNRADGRAGAGSLWRNARQSPCSTDAGIDVLLEGLARLTGREGVRARRRQSARPELGTWE